jgi:GH24 family phage-related lysozyme (muramidase)
MQRQCSLSQVDDFNLSGVMVCPQQRIGVGLGHTMDLAVIVGKKMRQAQQRREARLLEDLEMEVDIWPTLRPELASKMR